jgi:glyoxylase-like metal-dependent hydrolase (beta-lactamase superfamily II)
MRWLEVADRVFVRRYAELDLSVGLVVGDGACLVVDTRGDVQQGTELATAVREITTAPWEVVLTHDHFDHCFGTVAFLPCAVWAQTGCRPDQQDPVAGVVPVPPNRRVKDTRRLDVGGRAVVLRYFGKAHTDNDLVVHVPDAGVVFAGDLVEQGAPPAFEDAYPTSWPRAVDGILALTPTIVVPGHGDPVDADFVGRQRDELDAIARLSAAVRDGERTTEDALRASPYPADVTKTAIDRVTAGWT